MDFQVQSALASFLDRSFYLQKDSWYLKIILPLGDSLLRLLSPSAAVTSFVVLPDSSGSSIARLCECLNKICIKIRSKGTDFWWNRRTEGSLTSLV